MARHMAAIDKRPTMAEWPIRIWKISEFPLPFEQEALSWMQGDFEQYTFVYAPVRRSSACPSAYLFGYGQEQILILREGENGVSSITLGREQIIKIHTKRELLHAELSVIYQENGIQKEFSLPYVPSVYYLYDPFLDWMLGLDREFSPVLAEREHPRPDRLYKESLTMFNFSLGAYRLGSSFSEYSYSSQSRRNRFMPWKKDLEEWLEVPMSRGTFQIHSFKYLTECSYIIKKD